MQDDSAGLRAVGSASLERQRAGYYTAAPLVGDRADFGDGIPKWRDQTIRTGLDPDLRRGALSLTPDTDPIPPYTLLYPTAHD